MKKNTHVGVPASFVGQGGQSKYSSVTARQMDRLYCLDQALFVAESCQMSVQNLKVLIRNHRNTDEPGKYHYLEIAFIEFRL